MKAHGYSFGEYCCYGEMAEERADNDPQAGAGVHGVEVTMIEIEHMSADNDPQTEVGAYEAVVTLSEIEHI